MILRAKWVVDRHLHIHRDGVVDTEDILPAVRNRLPTFKKVLDLGDSILMPGLVNAHCHLDYTEMCGKIPPPKSFASWIDEINRLKRSWTEADFSRSIANGMTQSLSYGTTTMANWVCSPQTVAALSVAWQAQDKHPLPMRISWLWEQIALKPVENRKLWDKWYSWISSQSSLWQAGLAPHAPYTCREEIIRSAANWSAEHHLPWSIHIAETEEEFEMFYKGQGPLFEYFQSLGRSMRDCGKTTPFKTIWQIVHESESPVLLIHANHFDDTDFTLLSSNVSRSTSHLSSVVHCPRSHTYFGHGKFPLQRFSSMGINVCLGTDSLASNSDLSMFGEMKQLAESHPQLDPQEIVRMATVYGARALGMEQNWLRWQDWIAIPADVTNSEEIWSATIHFTGKPAFVMVAKNRISPQS